MLMRVWAWISAGLGLAIMVMTYIDGAIVGVWADEHQTAAETYPDDVLPFFVAGIGFVLLVGGHAVALAGGRRATPAPGYERHPGRSATRDPRGAGRQ
ncbi:hypothetical protein [Frondihabitans australicus]|uniref:Uncharacterized protein n=1 Tax=Frondihabitans australicus TaxID=386892 RepID=A0A495IAS5_9MICO|nr:hypothetical protein [Frondihabitans australicus]RKR73012.1 hypothetical protein C8E83_0094 [Frondihabitans australicus]